MTATGACLRNVFRRCNTPWRIWTWSGWGAIGASVPSKSKAQSTPGLTTSASRARPDSVNKYAIKLLLYDPSQRRVTVRANLRRHALALPHARRVEQHPTGPAIDVEVPDQGPHAAHALAL